VECVKQVVESCRPSPIFEMHLEYFVSHWLRRPFIYYRHILFYRYSIEHNKMFARVLLYFASILSRNLPSTKQECWPVNCHWYFKSKKNSNCMKVTQNAGIDSDLCLWSTGWPIFTSPTGWVNPEQDVTTWWRYCGSVYPCEFRCKTVFCIFYKVTLRWLANASDQAEST
jgi:hypothetical protein